MSAGSKRPDLIEGPESFAEAFKVSHETIHRLRRYAELLEHWQKTTNLVAPSTLPQVWSRHFADSAQLAALAPEARLWLDLGSGGGFPGLVVAILNSGTPGFRMHLVESNQKKCAFLGQVARATEAPVDIHAMRIEQFAKSAQSLDPDVVSARALAPLPRLLELAEPFLRDETRGLFLKGRETDAEVASALERWTFDGMRHASLTDDDARIVEIKAPRRRDQ
ncbi:16S rRNA (guanine(527)-N(7))-methyltransferase RsmG [Methyloceanibacter sp.]|uniref:16S rRNA (guanine(527)-N(7))-methyltransferase RsmG n=1 Tax=Methyloceanibacter sp. TaxID=1965321 RepID=UPI002B9F0F00|nr:16S rRNA (guanine(527)-N(7))-methyltransferase RsmG [Methyloceanibacter sp.]HML91588.1 16S rRNA (guanine(527)-N(7))-methyltransferase RsmG [Methyloceanibacter sp.]